MGTIEKPTLEWSVCIRGVESELVRIAETASEHQAELLTKALLDAGLAAIYFKPLVEF